MKWAYASLLRKHKNHVSKECKNYRSKHLKDILYWQTGCHDLILYRLLVKISCVLSWKCRTSSISNMNSCRSCMLLIISQNFVGSQWTLLLWHFGLKIRCNIESKQLLECTAAAHSMVVLISLAFELPVVQSALSWLLLVAQDTILDYSWYTETTADV